MTIFFFLKEKLFFNFEFEEWKKNLGNEASRNTKVSEKNFWWRLKGEMERQAAVNWRRKLMERQWNGARAKRLKIFLVCLALAAQAHETLSSLKMKKWREANKAVSSLLSFINTKQKSLLLLKREKEIAAAIITVIRFHLFLKIIKIIDEFMNQLFVDWRK